MDTSDTGEGAKKQFLRERVYSSIKSSIITGELEPRTRLIEEDLAEAMQASRTPVREAFQKLEEEGLICRRPRGGYAVKGVTEEEVEEIFGVVSVLEGYAGFLAAARITREELEGLEEIVGQQQACLENMRAEKFMELDATFHDVLHRAARNARLYALLHDLRNYMYRCRALILHYHPNLGGAVEDHKAMLECINARNGRRAETLMRRHINRGKNLIKRKLQQLI